MKKIVTVVGARPQFIKHFPLELELKKYFNVISVHTGQHFDDKMSKIFFDELNISKPDYRLNLTKSSHAGQTGEMLFFIEEILIKENPVAIVVYGDTNSTLAGALAAAKIHVPVIHVEAGLRSYNKEMPEEINRIMTDHVSSLLFCSSNIGINNLITEGITNGVSECGDLMKDALLILKDKLSNFVNEPYIYATFHRPYNTDGFERISEILNNLNSLPAKVVFPVHPRTRKVMENNNLILSSFENIQFIEPVGYIESLSYQKFSLCVVTDSGGIQKEAYWLKRKCITVRSETEWVETLNGNWNELVFKDLNLIGKSFNNVPNESEYQNDLYGNGDAAVRITSAINLAFNSLK
ncbi:MAG: UDP-N-acetylglucosamine 2-epimerase (non-hydrolyzing) [Sphingobacteriia bacterium]|jgi:UDP-GlcNAc3NAcA epimerase